MNKLFELIDRLWDLLVVNFFWIVYVFRGFVILGFFPAITAVYGVVRYWIINGNNDKIHILFKDYYKENFKISNMSGWLLTILTLAVFMNWYLIPAISDPVIKTVAYGLIIPFSIFLILVWIYLFPVLVHFRLELVQYFIVILKLSVTFFSYTILQMLLIVIYGILVLNFTFSMAFFGITFIAVTQMFICNHIFQRINSTKQLEA